MPGKYHFGFLLSVLFSLAAIYFSLFGDGLIFNVGFLFGLVGVIVNPILWRVAANSWVKKIEVN